MKARLNTTGTHVHKGVLKVRVDLYPDVADRTYYRHYIDVFDRPLTDEERADPDGIGALVPTHKEVTPCLCHFVTVAPEITSEELRACIERTFNADVLATIDESLTRPDAIHLISPYMREKRGPASPMLAEGTDEAAVIAAVNARLEGLEVEGENGGAAQTLQPQSIDVGSPAIDRALGLGGGYTRFNLDNPANADGVIDTVEVYSEGIANVKPGTFYLVSGTTYACRDSEPVGNASAGYCQFTGLDISILTGDYIGEWHQSSGIDRDASGYAGIRQVSGDYADPDDTVTYILESGDTLSLYGTGTESGGGEAKTTGDSGAGTDAVDTMAAVMVSNEAGSGLEAFFSRSFILPDVGSGMEAVLARELRAGEVGQGLESSHLPGNEQIISADAGYGIDSLLAATARAGHDARLRPDRGRVGLPHKEVNQ